MSSPDSSNNAPSKLLRDESKQLIEYSDLDELKKRQVQINQIEQDVLQIHDMVNDIKSMTEQQQESIDVIATNINDTKQTVQKGHEELIQAEIYQRSYREKIYNFSMALAVAGVILIAIIRR